MGRALAAGILFASAGLAQSVQPAPSIAAARTEIQRLIAASGAEVAVAWRPLDAKPSEELLQNADMRFHAASTRTARSIRPSAGR